jgi:hypothetical protein
MCGCAMGPGPEGNAYHGWERVQTLWAGPAGAVVALYERPTALSKNPESIVCEVPIRSGIAKRVLVPSLAGAFPWVEGNMLYVYDTRDRVFPGWYQIERRHDLNWFQRTFSDEPLGGYKKVDQPDGISLPAPEKRRGFVFTLQGNDLRRVIDERRVSELWDVPAEGLVYVAEPGIAVRQEVDLLAVCR